MPSFVPPVEMPAEEFLHRSIDALARERDEARTKALAAEHNLEAAREEIRALQAVVIERDRFEEAFNTCCDNWADTRSERDRLREALQEIRDLPAEWAYTRIQRITNEALAGKGDET